MYIVASPMRVDTGQYFAYIAKADGAAHSAMGRVGRFEQDSKSQPLSKLDPARLTGAIEQADLALQYIARAERYRLREDDDRVPPGTVRYVSQALADLELGTRALRRAGALLTDPLIDDDPFARDAALTSIGIASSHYQMADWLLEAAPTAPDQRPDPSAPPSVPVFDPLPPGLPSAPPDSIR